MKFTEGAFRDWGYEVAREEFGDLTISEDDLWEKHDGKLPEGRILIKDRIADAMFQQLLLRPDEYEVIATTNLNGDYLSDACAAQVGGLGIAPGANIGAQSAIFEATHGTAPKYAGQDKVNPGSVILSGVMMLQYLGWDEAGELIERAIEAAIEQKTGHLRFSSPDGRCDQGLLQRIRRRPDQEYRERLRATHPGGCARAPRTIPCPARGRGRFPWAMSPNPMREEPPNAKQDRSDRRRKYRRCTG